MRIGNERHEKILHETLNQLQEEGYRTINLEGKSPTAVAVNNGTAIAITILKDRHKTITFLEDSYNMFDKVDRITMNKKNKKDIIDKTIRKYRNKGFNIIYLQNKSPDAIAIKNNLIFAIEVLGIKKGHDPKFHIQNKEQIYEMFDGIMIKTFNYDNDSVFTEVFGRGGKKF